MFELAVILQDGLKRMYQEQEERSAITSRSTTNPIPCRPCRLIQKKEYSKVCIASVRRPKKAKHRAQLLASGPLVNEALQAQELLLERYGVAADLWSVTSYKMLRIRALEAERWNMWHPDEPPRKSYLQTDRPKRFEGPSVAVSDYVRIVPEQIAPWYAGRPASWVQMDSAGAIPARPCAGSSRSMRSISSWRHSTLFIVEAKP